MVWASMTDAHLKIHSIKVAIRFSCSAIRYRVNRDVTNIDVTARGTG